MSNHVIINFTKAVIRVQFDMSTKESFPFAVRVAVGCECPALLSRREEMP